MSKVRLYGDVSGYVDLKAPDVANDVTITLPNESGPFATETYVNGAIEDFATENYVDAAVATAGGLVAVKHALFTGTQTASVTAGNNVAVNNLSITHSTAANNNKLIISAYIGVAATSHTFGDVGIAVFDGTTRLAVGASPGSRSQVSAGGIITGSGVDRLVVSLAVTFVFEPGTTASKTYTVRAFNTENSTRTLYINRSQVDSNSANNSRGSSGLVIQEVKV